MGTTEDGRVWCVKALHPSDPLTSVRGVPDQSAIPTTVENWQQQLTIPSPPDAGDDATEWDCQIYFIDDPSYWGVILTKPDTGNGAIYGVPNNPMATVGGYEATDKNMSAAKGVCDSFTAWRRAYAGVTVHLVAPQLTNQGTVTAAQYKVRPTVMGGPSTAFAAMDERPRKGSVAGEKEGTAPNWSSAQTFLAHPLVAYEAKDLYDYDTLQSMPNAYVGQARDGVYMPLKLDSNHAVWHTKADLVYDGSGYETFGTNAWLDPTIKLDKAQAYAVGPYQEWGRPYSGSGATYFGFPHLLPCTSITGAIVFKGLDMKSSLLLQYRMGFECACAPGTTFSPFLKLAPAWDPAAVNTYFAIARELKDAYPADYNDLGKLWDVIKGAARVVLPFVRPVLGQGLGTLARWVAGPGEKKADRAAKTGKLDKPPAAAQERAEKAASAAAATRTPRKLRIARRGS